MTQKIRSGRQYEFSCTMEGADANGLVLRNYTGQRVRVVRHKKYPEVDVNDIWLVRANDGVEFDAFTAELNGFHKEHGPTFGAEGRVK